MPHRAYIFDALRTPRSKGKPDGSLYEVKPVALAAGVLQALQQRHDLDTAYVDDVVIGCVMPVGEQGSDIAKMALQFAGWSESVPGVQLDRFCASGLEAVNIAAQKVASGWEDLVVAGGVESMSRVPMGSNGGAMGGDAELSLKAGFVPQGIGADMIATLDGLRREDVDRFAVASQRRVALLPDVPTFAEAGVPGIEVRVWFGLLTTTGTAADVIAILNSEAVRIVRAADMQERIVSQGMDPVGNTPPQFAALIKQEITKYAGLVKPAARPE